MRVDFELTGHQALIKFPLGEYQLVDIYKMGEWYYFKSLGGRNFINLRSNHDTSKPKCMWLHLYLMDGFTFKEGLHFKIEPVKAIE